HRLRRHSSATANFVMSASVVVWREELTPHGAWGVVELEGAATSALRNRDALRRVDALGLRLDDAERRALASRTRCGALAMARALPAERLLVLEKAQDRLVGGPHQGGAEIGRKRRFDEEALARVRMIDLDPHEVQEAAVEAVLLLEVAVGGG